MICALHLLDSESKNLNLENNSKLIKDITNDSYLISNTEKFTNEFRFNNVFIEKNKSEDFVVNQLNFLKLTKHILRFFQLKNYKICIYSSSNIKLSPEKFNNLKKYINTLTIPHNDDIIMFEDELGIKSCDFRVFRIDYIKLNLNYFDCTPEELILKFNSNNFQLIFNHFLNSKFSTTLPINFIL